VQAEHLQDKPDFTISFCTQ